MSEGRIISAARAAAQAAGIYTPKQPKLPDSPPAKRVQVTKRVRNADVYNSRPGSGVTVEQILSIYRIAENGDPVRQCDLFDNLIEFDGHGRGLFAGRNQAVAGKNWTMQAGGPDAGSGTAAQILGTHLKNNAGFRQFVEHQLTAIPYGFAASEIVWDVVDGVWLPVRFVNVPHRRFGSPTSDQADEIWLRNGDSRADMIPLEMGQWAVNRVLGRNPYAAGLMRTCAFWMLFKRWSNRDWQVFGEMFGLPSVVGFYSEGASASARAALEDAVKNLGEEGFAILEETCELLIKEASRAGDASSVYPAQWTKFEEQMSKAISGGTLTSDTGSIGSYAQANTHADRAFVFALADAAGLEEMFVRDISVPFVTWNGFGGALPPRPKFQIVREQSLKAQAEILELLSRAFGDSFSVAWEQVAEVFGWRVPVAGEAALVPAKEKPAAVPGEKP